jgi:predicted adenylyl cyclase CyaB
MGLNIELKARCANLEDFENRVKQLSHKLDGHDNQTDTFYKVPAGRLKLRESSLYGNFLIPYLRRNESGPKRSDYSLLPVEDVPSLKELLQNMFGILIVVKKERTIYLHENVRIHLDRVEDLGDFIEFEAVVHDKGKVDENHQKLDNLIDYFKIKENDFIQNAYADMLLNL